MVDVLVKYLANVTSKITKITVSARGAVYLCGTRQLNSHFFGTTPIGRQLESGANAWGAAPLSIAPGSVGRA
mgnify:CR=1 FL=1